jgi:ribosomal protein L37AE/L43A
MRDPRYKRGEPQPWGGPVNPRMERRTLLRTVLVELGCPSCRRGTLSATGEVLEAGNLHTCSHCDEKYTIAGQSYPKQVTEPDAEANLLRAR